MLGRIERKHSRGSVRSHAPRWLTSLRVLCAAVFGYALVFGGEPRAVPSHDRLSVQCATCHVADYQSTNIKHTPHAGVRPTTCATCHSSTAWRPSRLQHSWPLEGAHAKADCFGCHRGEPRQFEGTSETCLDCHQADDQKANARVEHHAQFSGACETCHTANGWKPKLAHDWAAPMAAPLSTVAAANARPPDADISSIYGAPQL